MFRKWRMLFEKQCHVTSRCLKMDKHDTDDGRWSSKCLSLPQNVVKLWPSFRWFHPDSVSCALHMPIHVDNTWRIKSSDFILFIWRNFVNNVHMLESWRHLSDTTTHLDSSVQPHKRFHVKMISDVIILQSLSQNVTQESARLRQGPTGPWNPVRLHQTAPTHRNQSSKYVWFIFIKLHELFSFQNKILYTAPWSGSPSKLNQFFLDQYHTRFCSNQSGRFYNVTSMADKIKEMGKAKLLQLSLFHDTPKSTLNYVIVNGSHKNN